MLKDTKNLIISFFGFYLWRAHWASTWVPVWGHEGAWGRPPDYQTWRTDPDWTAWWRRAQPTPGQTDRNHNNNTAHSWSNRQDSRQQQPTPLVKQTGLKTTQPTPGQSDRIHISNTVHTPGQSDRNTAHSWSIRQESNQIQMNLTGFNTELSLYLNCSFF